jgi:hypothetical protein
LRRHQEYTKDALVYVLLEYSHVEALVGQPVVQAGRQIFIYQAHAFPEATVLVGIGNKSVSPNKSVIVFRDRCLLDIKWKNHTKKAPFALYAFIFRNKSVSPNLSVIVFRDRCFLDMKCQNHTKKTPFALYAFIFHRQHGAQAHIMAVRKQRKKN